MADYHQARIDAGIKQYRLNGDVSTLEEALGDQSTTNGFFAGAASREIVEAAKRADRGAESGNRTLSFVASLIPYAGPVASYAVDEGKPIAADNEENAVDVANQSKSDSRGLNKDQMTVALLNGGLYRDEELLDIANRADYSGGGTSVDEVINRSTGRPLIGEIEPENTASLTVRNGLDYVGNEIYSDDRFGIDFEKVVGGGYNNGYSSAYSADGAAPPHSWEHP